MKIGIMIDYIASGSAPKTIGQEVRGLKKLGHETSSIVIKGGGYSPSYKFHMNGIKSRVLLDEYPRFVKRIDRRVPGFSFFSFHHLLSPLFAPSVINDKEYDVLVVHSAYTCFTAKKLKTKRNIPFIPFIWDPMSHIFPHVYKDLPMGKFIPILKPIVRWADSFIMKDAQAIITSGKWHHELLKTLTDKKLEILYPGCFPVSEVNDDREDFILSFDRWDIGNTPHNLLDILERVEKDIKLIVGGHWYPESIKESFLLEIQRRNLSNRVKIIGSLNEQQIIEYCSKAMVLVHMNKEAFGMQSLEAASCGCPIVIPAGSGVTELFNHGIHGFFPEENDIDKHVEYINKLYVDKQLARKIGKSAWEIAKKQTWQKHSKDLEDIIKRNI